MGKIVRKGVEYGGSSNSADCIKYNDTKSVKEAIDEIKASSISNPTAASVTFDNTDTGLNATNVQDAVTEVNGKLTLIDVSEVVKGTNITTYYMYKIGRIVYFSVNVLGVTIGTNSAVSRVFISGNYPEQVTALSIFASSNSTPTTLQAAITTDGNIVLRSNTAVSNKDYVVSGFYVSK